MNRTEFEELEIQVQPKSFNKDSIHRIHPNRISNSQWTLLLLTIHISRIGACYKLHPLANTHAEHTTKKGTYPKAYPFF